MPIITFVHERYAIEVPEGTNIRDAAIESAIHIHQGFAMNANCRGHGICGQCRVDIEPIANVSDPTISEKLHLVDGNARLACKTEVHGDIRVYSFRKKGIDPHTMDISSPVPEAITPETPLPSDS